MTEGHLIVRHLVKAGKPVLVGPSFGSKSKQELREKSFATAGILDDAGLEVCIITDAPVIPLYYLPLCAGLAVKAGMKEESAWRAITINPAHVGIDGRVGSIEAGKDADIAIFEGNPLRDIQCRTKAVFVNGEEVLSPKFRCVCKAKEARAVDKRYPDLALLAQPARRAICCLSG